MTWFLLQDDEICGPYETAHIFENCDEQCLIWGPGMDEWSGKEAWQAFLKQPKKIEEEPVQEVQLEQQQDIENKTVEEVAELALHQLNDNWFFAYDGERFGPLNQNHLILKISSLAKPEEVLLWKKGEENWKPLFNFPKILNALNAKMDEKAAA